MLTIIDYGIGNILAFANVFTRLNVEFAVATEKTHIDKASKLILPGVGAFDSAMKAFNQSGMRDAVELRARESAIPLIGICVGMQMLAEGSEEGSEPGLNLVPGFVKKFDLTSAAVQVPHMGWNSVVRQDQHPLFEGLSDEAYFYFLHSYYYLPGDVKNELAVTEYGKPFSSAVHSGNVFGVQFHPEKSHSNGHTLLKNFAEL